MADEKQNLHANKIAAERVLMDATGMTRNQLRQSVKNSAASFVDAFQSRPIRERQEPTIQRKDTLLVEHPQIFRTPPFQPFGQTGGPAGDGATGPAGADGFTLDGVNEGDMLYWDGAAWALIPRPTSMTNDPVMRYNLSTDTPYWDEPQATC